MDNEDQDGGVSSPYDVNPFQPPSSGEPVVGEGWRSTLGRNYWVPMSVLVVVVLFVAYQAGWSALLPAAILFFALLHGVRYQMRLNHQANWGVLEPRLPDFGVFLLSCLIGVAAPIAAGIAFFTSCSMTMMVFRPSTVTSGARGLDLVICFVAGGVAAAVAAVLLSRFFLPRKPKP